MSWRWAGDVTGVQLPRVEPPVCRDLRGRAGPRQRLGCRGQLWSTRAGYRQTDGTQIPSREHLV